MRRTHHIFQKLLLGWMIGVLLVSSTFVVPRTVLAQGLPVIDSSLVGFKTKEEIEKAILKPLGVALIQILLNLISFVANRLAYDAALAIASGGKGQSANYEYRSVEEYGQDLWQDVLGESIGQLSEGLNVVGVNFDVCAPTSPLKTLNLQLGIAGGTKPEPTCNFRDIQSNWEGFVASIQEDADPNRIFDEFAASFGEGQTELSSTISILSQTYAQAAQTKETKTDELFANDRFKDVEDFITGNVKTPATVLEDQFKSKLDEAQGNQTEALQGALFGNEGALLQIGVSAGSVFLNTLLSQLTNKIYTGLFEPPTTGGVFNPDFINIRGRDRARETFKGLLTTPIQTLDQYNVVNQFVTCPGSTNRGPNNCVMDTSFAAIISRAEAGEAMTIQEAIDADLLHGGWPLVSSARADLDQDAFCYTQAYCYSNLVKMRVARIIPVGLELAADKSGQGNLPVITLQQAVDAFNECNTENTDALLDANNPYCHLVDPNWVIKYPETQCRAQVYGQTLVAESANVRAQTCVDTPSCIAEDENGNCIGGYGYCTRERNVWQFDGDVCPAQYASCTTLTSREGTRESLLTNTVDFAGCNADNAGCAWFRTEQERNDNSTPADLSDDTFTWGTEVPNDNGTPTDPTDDSVDIVDTDPATVADVSAVRTYLNAQVQACRAEDAGCSDLVRAASSTLNPVLNASFEDDTDQDNVPDYWDVGALVEYRTAGVDSAFGSDAVWIPEGEAILTAEQVRLPQNQFVTVSFHARGETALNTDVESLLTFVTAENVGVTPTVSQNSPNCTSGGGTIFFEGTAGDTYERFSCTFTTPSADTWMTVRLEAVAGDTYIDGVQIDEQEVTTNFHVGYGASSERVAIRVAPDYLACTGNATDAAACDQYAPVCRASEVGCTAYTPTNGDPTVPGIINSTNVCPSECVGYDTYRQLASNFSAAVFPTYFIADTARSCTAEVAGCSEFTNLDALAEGGESRAYFTDVRTCQEVDEAVGTGEVYYTWEGSDSAGFQLQTWSLKGSNAGDAPCTNFNASSGACVDTSVTAPAGCTQHADIFLDPDCREFYDADGDIHYRYYSDTITVDNACSPYRKTNSTLVDCQSTGGVWNVSAGNCTYNIMPSQSTQCTAASNGCRGYTGNTGNNTRFVLREFFENGSLSDWPDIAGSSIYSNESVAAGGRSMQIGDVVAAQLSEGEIFADRGYILSFWAKGSGTLQADFVGATGPSINVMTPLTLTSGWQEYTFGPVTPTAVGFDEATARLTFDLTGTAGYVDNVILREVQDTAYLIENSWVTPSTCDQTPQGVAAPQFFLGCQEYTTHRGETVDLKSFASICREEVIGCEGFFNTQNSNSPYPQAFNLTCTLGASPTTPTACAFNGEDVCTVFPGQTTCRFQSNGIDAPFTLAPVLAEDSEVISRDEKIYLVDLPQYRCAANAAGCTLYGSPTFNIDHSEVIAYAGVALLNDPDRYEDILCEQENLFCDAYSTDGGALFYFKNPGSQKCEYKTSVTIEGTRYAGWFRVGVSEPCYYDDINNNGLFDAASELTDSYLIGGTDFGIWHNGDEADYSGWVGTCPAEQNACAEFVDVVDTADGLHPNGRPYFYLNNDRIHPADDAPSESCNGLISQETGCVGLNNNATPFVTFNASASYIKSWHADTLVNADQPFTPVDPVDCSVDGGGEFTLPDGSTIDLCKSFCVYPSQTGFSGGLPSYNVEVQGSCVIDQDCGTRTDMFGADQQGSCYKAYEPNPDSIMCLGGAQHGQLVGNVGVCDLSQTFSVSGRVQSLFGVNQTQPNDANTILNVRRDRQCSEWLACDNQTSAWDDEQGRFVSVCNSVSLCNEYSSLGSQSFCSNWIEEPTRLLDDVEYANRDVTWYGSEFSGYSIPDQYAVQDYSQININPEQLCQNSVSDKIYNVAGGVTAYNSVIGQWDNGVPAPCTSDSFCIGLNADAICTDAEEDYRLAVTLGPCVTGTANGVSCSVGQCTDTLLACASNADCGTSPGVFCNLAPTVAESGQCFNGLCASSVDGTDLVNATRQECRGYPESNAPFPNDIVTNWTAQRALVLPNDGSLEERPTAFRPGFANATYCASGEACDCSYVTAEYGGGVKSLNLARGNGEDALPGVCVGGEFEGSSCTGDNQCSNTAGGGGGICEFITAKNTFIGWPGFCIQSDLSININASQDKNACLLWLPVDQLRGGTDIYNKFTEAGFSIANTAYCTQNSVFIDLGVTGAQDTISNDDINDTIAPACAASFPPDATGVPTPPIGFTDPLGAWFVQMVNATANGVTRNIPENASGSEAATGGCDADEYNSCWASVACPKNYFAVIGACEADANVCGNSAGPEGDVFEDCPYFCVPYGSKYELPVDAIGAVPGDVCAPPANMVANGMKVPINSTALDLGLTDEEEIFSRATWSGTSGPASEQGTDTAFGYLVNDEDFQALEDRYASCRVRGYEWNADSLLDNYYVPLWPVESLMISDLEHNWEYYLGCSELAFTSVEAGYGNQPDTVGNAAYTNRALTPNQNVAWQYTLNEAGMPSALSYNSVTQPDDVGRIVPSYEFTDASQITINDPTQADFAGATVLACNNSNLLLEPLAEGSACTTLTGNLTTSARSYDDTSFSLPSALNGGEFDCDIATDCPNYTAPTGGQCLSGVNNFACFVGCDEGSMQANDIATSYIVGDWDTTDGDAWCGAMDLGLCVADVDDISYQLGYVCRRYYGHPGSSVVGEANQAAALGTSQNVCNSALANGTFFDSSTWVDANPNGNWESFVFTTEHQCDGGDSDLMCDTDSQCGGSPGTLCLNNTCSIDLTSVPNANIIPIKNPGSTPAQVLGRLKQFFARVYSFWEYDDETVTIVRSTNNADAPVTVGGTGVYEKIGLGPFSAGDLDDRQDGDANGTGPNNGTPTSPQVASVTDNCVGTNCVEGETGTFSVNGSAGRIWNAQRSFLANIEFYAFTDPNQYPLKNVIVDWGDGQETGWGTLLSIPNSLANVWGRGDEVGSTTDDNYYKAHRGLNASQQQICVPPSGEEEWGKTSDSCQSGPFQFQHNYRCTPGMFNWLQVAGRECHYVTGTNILENSPCYEPGGDVCIFQPRVYVKDNWDYCTGVCTIGPNGNSTCQGSEYDPPINYGECDQTRWPRTEINDPGYPNGNYNNPWINWDGNIRITPTNNL